MRYHSLMGKRIVAGLFVAALLAAVSCKNQSTECRQMRACCKGAKADAQLASLVEKSDCATADDPSACTKAYGALVVSIVQEQFRDRSITAPKACIPSPK